MRFHSPKALTLISFVTLLVLASCSKDDEIVETDEDSAPVIETEGFTLAEHTLGGTVIGTVVATDPNGDTITYSVSGNLDIAIDDNTGELRVGPTLILDYETTPELQFTVEAFDGTHLVERQLTVQLIDVDEKDLLTGEEEKVLTDFETMAFWLHPDDTPVSTIKKWNGPIRVTVEGNGGAGFDTTLAQSIVAMEQVLDGTALDIALASDPQDANVTVFFGSLQDLEVKWPDMFAQVEGKTYSGFTSSPYVADVISSARVWISVDSQALVVHEFGHVLGLGHSVNCQEESVFCPNFFLTSTILGSEALAVHYFSYAVIAAGMDQATATAILANLLVLGRETDDNASGLAPGIPLRPSLTSGKPLRLNCTL